MLKNHLTEMKRQLLTLSKVKGVGRILGDSSFRRIPSVSEYKVKVQPYNKILKTFGISLRLPKKVEIKLNSSEKMNRYMGWTIKRIRKMIAGGDISKAWNVISLNVKYSKSFRASAFNYILSGWYYKIAESEIWKINRDIEEILYRGETKLKYKRVYIEKANGKKRPLGVPSVEWRVSLHLINGFLVEMLKGKLTKNQHGYIPGKGVLTAWQEVIKRIGSKYIYETDLKGFFDNVSIWESLEKVGPRSQREVIWLKELCKSIPELPEKPEEDETRFNIPEGYNKGWWEEETREKIVEGLSKQNLETSQWLHRTSEGITSTPLYSPLSEFIRANGVETLRELMLEDGCETVDEFLQTQWALLDVYSSDTIGSMENSEEKLTSKSELEWRNFGLVPGGFPQGMPLSPFLSILVLKEYLTQCDSVNYADDQLFFSEKEEKILDNDKVGIHHAPEKCRWIKKKGVWQENSMKFLGFRLSRDGVFLSETRSGVRTGVLDILKKLYSEEGIKEIKKIKKMEDLKELKNRIKTAEVDEWDSLRSISKRNIFGFIMACMNTNDWENNHGMEDQKKAMRNYRENLHPKSLIGRIPGNLDSSKSMPFLLKVIAKSMKVKKVQKVAAVGKS